LRHRQPMPPEMSRKCKERKVLFTHTVQNSDRPRLSGTQANDFSPGRSQFALQRLHPFRAYTKALLEKLLQHIHRLAAALVYPTQSPGPKVTTLRPSIAHSPTRHSMTSPGCS